MKTKITPTLDRIEKSLPPVSRRLFRLNRSVTAATLGAVTKSADAVRSATGAITKSTTTSAKTVVGQAKAQVGQTVKTATTGAKTVAGQVKAEVGQTVDLAEDETIDLIESANDTVAGKPTGAYDTWTKAELYERAQELDIDGRSAMGKNELIGALRKA